MGLGSSPSKLTLRRSLNKSGFYILILFIIFFALFYLGEVAHESLFKDILGIGEARLEGENGSRF